MTGQELRMLAKLAAEGNKTAKRPARKKNPQPEAEAAPAAELEQPQIEQSQQFEQPYQEDYSGDINPWQNSPLGLYDNPYETPTDDYSWYWEPYSKVASAHDAYELGMKLAFGAAEKKWGMQKVSAGVIDVTKAVTKRVAKGGARGGAARNAESAASRGRASVTKQPVKKPAAQRQAPTTQPAAAPAQVAPFDANAKAKELLERHQRPPAQAAAPTQATAPAQAAAPAPRPATAPAQPGPAAPRTPQEVYAESSNAFANIPKPKQPTRLDRISEDARRAQTQPYPTQVPTAQVPAAAAPQVVPPPPQRGWGWKGMMGAGTLGAGIAGVGLGGVALGAASQGVTPNVHYGNYPSWTAPQQNAAYGGYTSQI